MPKRHQSISKNEAEGAETERAHAEAAERAGFQAEEQGGSESEITSGVHPVDQFCGLLDDADFPYLKDGDVDGYMEAIRGQ